MFYQILNEKMDFNFVFLLKILWRIDFTLRNTANSKKCSESELDGVQTEEFPDLFPLWPVVLSSSH
jgi:hypothetical protein